MKGSIRMLLGFLIAFGAVGTLDYDPNASVVLQGLLAAAGLLLAHSGVNAMTRSNREF
jgi:hypothetical protein